MRTGPNFGLTGNAIAPPFVSRIGAPTGGNGSFGAASNFPGMGSAVGSILPGIVLSTRRIPPNPDVRRADGSGDCSRLRRPICRMRHSSTGSTVNQALRTWWWARRFAWLVRTTRWDGASFRSIAGIRTKPTTSQGFNQMQRGASPGGDIGDFGVIGFVDGRLSQHVNVSANVGYILNSNPKSEAMGDAVLLDRPDEFLAGVGFDFPINKHFQLIAEARSTMYVAGKTPNAFNNNPVEALGGVRIFPARWWGIGAAYRRHMNQQDAGHFEGGLPGAFKQSDDPNGFIFQFWAGHRNPRMPPPPPNQPPTVSVSSSSASITAAVSAGNKFGHLHGEREPLSGPNCERCRSG